MRIMSLFGFAEYVWNPAPRDGPATPTQTVPDFAAAANPAGHLLYTVTESVPGRTLQAGPLLDEPTSALDPKATARIEELTIELREYVTITLVRHNIAQAARVSNLTAFLYLGELVEFGPSERLFTVPEDKRTAEYLTGKFG